MYLYGRDEDNRKEIPRNTWILGIPCYTTDAATISTQEKTKL